MSSLIVAPQFYEPVDGAKVEYTDWNQLFQSALASIGGGAAFQQGVQHALPLVQPLAVTPTTGMNVSVGGVSANNPQFVMVNANLAAAILATTYTVPNNATGSTRNDIIAVTQTLIQVSSVSREVEDTSGNKTIETLPIVVNGLAVEYLTGATGGALPTVSAPYVDFAHIAVPNGAVSVNSSEITVSLPNMNPQGAGATMTTSVVTAPAVGASVTIPVARTDAFPVGTPVYCVNVAGTTAFTGTVTSRSTSSNAGTLTIKATSYVLGTPSSSMGIGTTITFGGIQGATGASGHGTTSNIAGIVLPGLNANVSFAVLDPTAFPVGASGLAVGPANVFAFYFTVLSVAGNTLTVQLTSYALGGVSGVTLGGGGTITFSGPPAFPSNTSAVTVPAVGSSVNIPLNYSAPFPPASYGLLAGPGGVNAFLFQVNTVTGTNINAQCIAITAGAAGNSLSSPGICYPLGSLNVTIINGATQPAALTQADTATAGSFSSGTPGPTCHVDVTFLTPFATATSYRIQLTPTAAGGTPFWDVSNSNATKFRIRYDSPSTVVSDVSWTAIGH
jgi:hypothetical protein